MIDNTPPTTLNIEITLWTDCIDNRGNKYSQLLIEETPSILYKFLPAKEKPYIKSMRVYVKEFEFLFKRKKYIIQFLHTKEPGKP